MSAWSRPGPFHVAQMNRAAIADAVEQRSLRVVAPIGRDRWLVRIMQPDSPAIAHHQSVIEAFDAFRMVDPSIRQVLAAGIDGQAGLLDDYWLIPTDRDRPARRRLAARIFASGGSPGIVETDGLLMRASLTPAGLAQLIASGDVLWAEQWSAPETDDAFTREFGGANAVETIEGFIGAGVVVEIVDKGLLSTHNDLLDSDPFLRTLNEGPTDHGTATYGIIFGSGGIESAARGMMPGQQGLFSSYLEIADRDTHFASFVGDFDGDIQSNSWGSSISRRYTATSAELDDSIARHGVLVFQSQSNRGSPDSRPEAWAKNAISVGGINGHGTLDRGDDTWAGDASTGPAIDGRIKPDLVLFNDGILTTSDQSETTFAPFTGTSAATPAVAGHAGIMIEMWRAGVFHGGDPLAISDDRPSVAMSRALLINSAEPYAFSHAADDLGRYRQGWGTPDLLNMWTASPGTSISDEQSPLAEGDAWTRVFEVEPGQPRIAFTLAWTDPAALPFADRTLINDLDLRVVSPGGEVYFGNAGLHDSPFSAEGGDPDSTNTIENVFIDDPEPGLWQVEVIADGVAVDAWEATPEIDAAFAFVASGVGAEPRESAIRILGPVPDRFSPRGSTTLEFEAVGFEPRGDGEFRVQWGFSVGAFPLVQTGPNRFSTTISGFDCQTEYDYRVTIPSVDGEYFAFPADGATNRLSAIATADKRSEPLAEFGWNAEVSGDTVSGAWERGAPAGGGLRWDPPFDADGDGLCWMTDNRPGDSGVVGGTATLTTGTMSFAGIEHPHASYDLWLAGDAAGTPAEDTMLVEVSYNLGFTWSPLVTERSSFRWQSRRIPLDPGESTVAVLRFTVGDGGDGSLIEAAVDGVAIEGDFCPPCRGGGGDGVISTSEIDDFSLGFNNQSTAADVDGNGMIDLDDLLRFITDLRTRCR